MKHGKTVIAFVEDPDGYKVELIEESSRSRKPELEAGRSRPSRRVEAGRGARRGRRPRGASALPAARPCCVSLRVHEARTIRRSRPARRRSPAQGTRAGGPLPRMPPRRAPWPAPRGGAARGRRGLLGVRASAARLLAASEGEIAVAALVPAQVRDGAAALLVRLRDQRDRAGAAIAGVGDLRRRGRALAGLRGERGEEAHAEITWRARAPRPRPPSWRGPCPRSRGRARPGR